MSGISVIWNIAIELRDWLWLLKFRYACMCCFLCTFTKIISLTRMPLVNLTIEFGSADPAAHTAPSGNRLVTGDVSSRMTAGLLIDLCLYDDWRRVPSFSVIVTRLNCVLAG